MREHRCKGTTIKGAPCKLPAKPDGYCGVFHQAPAKRKRRSWFGRRTIAAR